MLRTSDYRKRVATIAEGATAREAAKLLAAEATGCAVVVDRKLKPLGMVTDRDLLIRILAEGANPDRVQIRDVMSWPAITASPDDPIETVIDKIRDHGIRRLAIVEKGKVVGLVAFDDLLVALSRSLDRLGRAALRQITEARRSAKVESVRRDLEDDLQAIRTKIEALVGSKHRQLLQEFDGFRDLFWWTIEEAKEEAKLPAGTERKHSARVPGPRRTRSMLAATARGSAAP